LKVIAKTPRVSSKFNPLFGTLKKGPTMAK
jgi:hypothetical protein